MLCKRWSTSNTFSSMLIATFLLTLALENPPRLAQADVVTDWNEITTQTILTVGRSPVLTSLDYALVHAAVYDAAIALDGSFEPYHVTITNPAGSPVAAVATAAHDVLIALFP